MNKYGAVRTTVDNVTFASKKEATRYRELCLLLKAGEIVDLWIQPIFCLYVESPQDVSIEIGKYIADFEYWLPDGTRVVEDVKGVRTALYRWKRKHVMAQYGIEITEI